MKISEARMFALGLIAAADAAEAAGRDTLSSADLDQFAAADDAARAALEAAIAAGATTAKIDN